MNEAISVGEGEEAGDGVRGNSRRFSIERRISSSVSLRCWIMFAWKRAVSRSRSAFICSTVRSSRLGEGWMVGFLRIDFGGVMVSGMVVAVVVCWFVLEKLGMR